MMGSPEYNVRKLVVLTTPGALLTTPGDPLLTTPGALLTIHGHFRCFLGFCDIAESRISADFRLFSLQNPVGAGKMGDFGNLGTLKYLIFVCFFSQNPVSWQKCWILEILAPSNI